MATNSELRLLQIMETLRSRRESNGAIESNGITDQFRSLSSFGGGAADVLASTALSSVFGGGGSSSSSAGSSSGSSVLSVASKVLESGLGLVPLVRGLLGLFGGGTPDPPPLVKYSMPQQLNFQGADIGAGISAADYDQLGLPRTYSPSVGSVAGGPSSQSTASASSPNIQVTVQTMDARSFLDHSTEIAQAVRSAMLNLSSLNDVVNEL
jgi:hypothetical protein